MKRGTILLAAVMAAGTAGVAFMASTAQAKHSSQGQSGIIHKGMTLEEAEQATGVTATTVGAPNNGVQTYRISYRQDTGDGGVNDHPTITVFLFGVRGDKITWVHKNQ